MGCAVREDRDAHMVRTARAKGKGKGQSKAGPYGKGKETAQAKGGGPGGKGKGTAKGKSFKGKGTGGDLADTADSETEQPADDPLSWQVDEAPVDDETRAAALHACELQQQQMMREALRRYYESASNDASHNAALHGSGSASSSRAGA